MIVVTPPSIVPTHLDAGSPARVVYGITSHVNPGQVLRLVRTIRASSPGAFILVHHDWNVSPLDTDAVRAVGECHVIRGATRVDWGRFNMLYPTMRSLEWLVDHRDFDWFVLLSGQDYPVQPLAGIERSLASTPYDGFVESTVVERASWLVGPSRYLYQYYELPKFRGWQRLRHFIDCHAQSMRARGRTPRILIPGRKDPGFHIGIRPLDSPFGGDFRCYVGSAWWTINRRCVDYLVRTWRRRLDLHRHYIRTLFAATESYPQTVLRNNRQLNLRNDDVRYVGWNDHRETGHPDVLGAKDFEAITTSGDHFARKFDDREDGRILDMLDEHIGVRSSAAR
jgi:hypothetical protein